MRQKLKIEPSDELAYWIGAVQADGYLRKYFDKHKKVTRVKLKFGIGEKSIPMVDKVKNISLEMMDRTGKIYKSRTRDAWTWEIRVKELMPIFSSLDIRFGDPPIPPIWALDKPEFFGAYLAGVIDGDGHIKLRRPKYPQCVIRISSAHSQELLEKSIEKILGCFASIRPAKDKKIYTLEFCVSSKTFKFVKKFIAPQLTLLYKRDRLLRFIESQFQENEVPIRELNPGLAGSASLRTPQPLTLPLS